MFISNADGTLVIASAGNITSEFNDFERAGWLFTSFGLASCAAQPLVFEFDMDVQRPN